MNDHHRRLSAEATPSQGPTPLQLKSQAALIGLINAVVSVPTMISYGPIIFQVLGFCLHLQNSYPHLSLEVRMMNR